MGSIASSFGGVIGGIVQSKAAKKAGKAQVRQAEENKALFADVQEQTSDLFQPFVDQGRDFGNVLQYELLGGEAPTIGGASEFTVVGQDGQPVRTFGSDREARQFVEAERDSFASRRTAANLKPTEIRESTFADENNNTSTERLNYIQAYNAAQNNALAELGPNPFNFQTNEVVTDPGTQYQGYELTPDYKFALEQGLGGIDNAFAARGSADSGARDKARLRFANGVASQGRSEFLNRLTQGQGLGFNATSAQANALSNFANGTSNANSAIGNAQSAQAIAQGNALASSISSGFELIGSIAGAGGGGGGGLGGILGQAGSIFGGAGGKSSFSAQKGLF